MEVGSKIRTLRSLKGLSQEKMAELLGISTNSYSKIERNETDINFSRLEQIAKVLEITPVELLGFGEKNFYYFHDNSHNNGGFVVNNTVPMEFNEMSNRIKVLEAEVKNLREMLDLVKVTLLDKK